MTHNWYDFNDAKTQVLPKDEPTVTVAEIKALLLQRLRDVLHYLLPAGVIKNGKFLVGDIHGNRGDSLVVEMNNDKIGQWHDFATNEGGDIISLWASVHGQDTRTQFPEIISAIYAWLGTPYTMRPKQTTVLPEEDLGPVTGKWDYHDAEGNLIACVYRYDPPTGKQFRPWDVATRRHRAPDVRPLYNQPAMKSADAVVLVEGEKSAQALIDAGICATTAMNGANAPIDKTDWSPLAGKHVLIWPDHDAAGLTYAQNVVARLKTLEVASLSVLSIPEDKPAKWDAADAVAEGFDISAFLSSSTRENITPCSPIPAFPIGHYLDDPSPMPEDLVAPRVLTPGGLLVLGGAPKVGKSDLLIHWLAHMAMGLPFLGMTPSRPLKIFYLQTEVGYAYLRERIRNICVPDHLMPLFRNNLVVTPQVRMLLNEDGVEQVNNTITRFFNPSELDVIVVDPLRNVYDAGPSGSENDNTAMLAFLQDRIEAIRYRTNPDAGVIIAHHTKKILKKLLEEDPFQALSGAGSLRSFYTTGMLLFRPDESQAPRQIMFELRNGKGIPSKFVDKVDGKWCEIENYSERLSHKEYEDKLDAERRRQQDVILGIIFTEARAGRLYTANAFIERFEGDKVSNLGSSTSIRRRLNTLLTKGYIKLLEGAVRSRNGYLCVEGMEMPASEVSIDLDTGDAIPIYKPVLPTHYRSPTDGTIHPIEDPNVWVYYDRQEG